MLYLLADWLIKQGYHFPGINLFRFISFRSGMAIMFSLIISLLIGKRIINLLRRKLIGESIREVGPESHKSKAGTPTMGGLIIIAAIVVPTLLLCDLTNIYIQLILFSTIWMGLIGFLDDYIKVFRKNKAGLKGRFKIIGQVGLGLIVGCTMVFHPDFKGPRGRVLNDGTVLVNDVLTHAGFRKGDQIALIGKEAFDPEKSDYIPTSTFTIYRVVRGSNPGFDAFEMNLGVSPNDSAEVWNSLWGPREKNFATTTDMPFVKDQRLNYGLIAFWGDPDGPSAKIIYILMVIFIVTLVSNGVNITDGLDGLAAGTSGIASATLLIFAYVSGNVIFSEYLNISQIPMTAELVIFSAALVGACVGFLWYNTHPAQVFMGDTGSLMLGGVIAVLALMVKKELLLPVFCGVFFLESFSVILQVGWFKFTKRRFGEGRRIFRMAPLHHHFELTGLHESKIVARFWIIAAMLAVLAFITLKIR